jgi:hypothetical protein
MINFARGLVTEDESQLKFVLTPYKDTLIQNLLGLLEVGLAASNYPLLEEVLNCLSIIASVLEEEFVPFYT